MIPISLQVQLTSPAYLSSQGTAGNFLHSLDHIPGRTLLGAAAWAWIDAGGDPEGSDFRELFLSGEVSWGDLRVVPSDAELEGMPDPTGQPLVAPLTSMLCKLDPVRHGVQDTLLVRPRGPEGKGAASFKERICGFHQSTAGKGHQRCEAGLDRCEGSLFYRSVLRHPASPAAPRQAGPAWQVIRVHKQRRTHVSISPLLGTARHGALYSREVLEEDQWFQGELLCSSQALADRVSELLMALPLAIGGGRSRGYGVLKVLKPEVRAPHTLSAPALLEFSDAASRALDVNASGAGLLFALTAASPWLFRGKDGGYERTLEAARLAAALELEPNDTPLEDRILFHARQVRSGHRASWDAAAGLPLELRHLIAAGSTFLCEVRDCNAIDLANRLSRLIRRGIGGQRVEGLGRITVNHPIFRSHEHA